MKLLKRLRKDAIAIFGACVKGADPEEAVLSTLRLTGNMLNIGDNHLIDISKFTRITLFGAGKASAAMARAVESVLGNRLAGGLVIVKYGHSLALRNVEVIESGHPTPTEEGVAATALMCEMVQSLGANDLVIGCFSGGGSALLSLPAAGITLEDKIDLTEKLLSSGADISEINAIRKHVSRVKGGQLLARAYPATVVNLMVSDVIGDDPSTIASGPFAPDGTTYATAWAVLEKYDLLEVVSPSIIEHLSRGINGEERETLKPGDPLFAKVHNHIVSSNILSLSAGAHTACHLGYRTLILSSQVRGETTQAAMFHAYIAEEIRFTGNPIAPPACLLSGGETTVKKEGNGLGGRNQHFVLALVEAASRIENCVFLSAGTDGTDGPTDAAGAIVDNETLGRAALLGLNPGEYLARFDSYHFFQHLEDLIKTGPTLTNVMDIHIVVLG